MDGQAGFDTTRKPIAIEAEQVLLGTLLIVNAAVDIIAPMVSAEDFYEPLHGSIYTEILRRVQAGHVASPVTLKAVFADDPAMTELGGIDYLARLARAVVSPESARDYAAVIAETARRRRMIEMMQETAAKLATADRPAALADHWAALERDVHQILEGDNTDRRVVSMARALEVALQQTEDRRAGRDGNAIATGLPSLDAVIGGLRPARNYLIAGRSGMGKTAVALEIVYRVAAKQGRGVIFASLEMEPDEVAHRLVSRQLADGGTRLPYQDLVTGGGLAAQDSLFRAALRAGRDIERLPVEIIDSREKRTDRLWAAIRRAQRRLVQRGKPAALVVIDYIQLMRTPGGNGRAEHVGEAALEIQGWAKALKLPFLTLSQVKREVEKERSKKPQLGDLRWAGEIEESSDAVIFVFRKAYYIAREIEEMTDPEEKSRSIANYERAKSVLELIVAKNRIGPEDTIRLWCDLPVNRVEEGDPAVAGQAALIPATDRDGFLQ